MTNNNFDGMGMSPAETEQWCWAIGYRAGYQCGWAGIAATLTLTPPHTDTPPGADAMAYHEGWSRGWSQGTADTADGLSLDDNPQIR